VEAITQEPFLDHPLYARHELPVLMYHRLVDRAPDYTKFDLHVTTADFEQQLIWLQRWGFTPVTFGDLMEKPAPRKPIVLSFDDGYEDNYLNLLPLLKKYQVKAVLYILGDRSVRRNEWDIPKGEPAVPLLSDAQVLEMSESGWVEFGAHSMTHQKLTEASSDEARRQVEDSKKSLEKLLGKPLLSFAYPYGSVNESVKRTVREAGFSFGIAVGTGPTRFSADPMEIRRVPMAPKTSRFEYLKKTSGFYLRYRKIFHP
jgi:peptidoglycan/xylan/chitin deacetylase (PgdA/CDA1 family)